MLSREVEKVADDISKKLADKLCGKGGATISDKKAIITTYIKRNFEFLLCGNSTPDEYFNVLNSIKTCLRSTNTI